MTKINYAFSEDRVIRDLQKYVDGTYDKHYAQRKYQATQFIEDCGHGEGSNSARPCKER